MASNVRMLIRIVQTRWWVPFILLTMLVVGCAEEGSVSEVDESKSTGTESTKGIETDTKEPETSAPAPTAVPTATAKPAPTPTSEPEAGKLELIEWDLEPGEFGITYAVGIVENNTASDFDWLTITFGTYDADGFKLGEAIDVAALRAGEKWKFKAMILEDNAAEVKVISLEGF